MWLALDRTGYFHHRTGLRIANPARTNSGVGSPAERALSRAAEFWLSRHPDRYDRDMRFDVIFLAPFAWPRHIVNAFH